MSAAKAPQLSSEERERRRGGLSPLDRLDALHEDSERFVDQTSFDPPDGPDPGNCMQACVASLLAASLDDVPHFVAIEGDEWWWSFISLLTNRGLSLLVRDKPIYNVLGIASGKSPRGEFGHVVLWKDDRIVHDPHPSREGLEGAPEEYWYFVPHDPATLKEGK